MKTLCVDIETTGLPTKRNASLRDDKAWPYIVQVSWMVVNNNNIEKIRDFIIKLPETQNIPIESTNIHGITNKMMLEKGVNIVNVLKELNDDVKTTNCLVCHNVLFDKNIIKAEMYRNKLYGILNEFQYGKYIEVCTMKTGKEICKIVKKAANGDVYYKYPKLEELYFHLFNEKPLNLHNSLIDICVCLRCFYKMRFDQDILSNNPTLNELFKKNMIHKPPTAVQVQS